MRSWLFAGLCLSVLGCSAAKESSGTSTSALTGTLSRDTFPSDPSLVVATNEKGASVSTAPDAKGAFKLALRKGHSYTLQVLLGDTSEPIVFPRASGALDETFTVSSGAALVSLGAVHHLGAAPQGGFVIKSLTPPASGAGDSAADGECEDGIDATTGAACVDEQGDLSCEASDAKEGDNQADGECENGVDATTGAACTDPPEADNQGDGECENGVDATTGAACTDAEEAAPDAPMAVPEHNVPDDVGGCDDSGEQEGDD